MGSIHEGFPYALAIRVLIGTNLNEWMTMDQMTTMATAQSDNKNTWSNKEVRQTDG